MADREFTNINGIKVCDQTARDNIPTKTSQLENDNDYVTTTQVNQAIDNAQLGGGEVDLSGYVTKETGNANQITFADGQTFQAKLDAGILKGEKGDKGDAGEQGPQGIQGPAGANGQDGLTTAINVNGNTYTHVGGVITLPDYPVSAPGDLVTDEQIATAVSNYLRENPIDGSIDTIVETIPDNNLFDKNNLVTSFTTNDGKTVTGNFTNYIKLESGKRYVTNLNYTQFYFFDKNKNHTHTQTYVAYPQVISDDGYVVIGLPSDYSKVKVLEGTDIDAYKPQHIKLRSSLEDNKWYGKKWLLIGDSISTDESQLAKDGYGKLISRELGMTLTNIAVSGKTMSWGYEQLDSLCDEFDLVTVMLGTNNQGYNCAIGSLNDTYYQSGQYGSNNSFYAQTQLMIEKLMTKFPKSKIIFLTPIKRTGCGDEAQYNDDNGYFKKLATTKEYRDVIIDCCNYYSIPYIDLYNCIDPRTEVNRKLYFVKADGSDGTHPNDLGHALFLAPVIKNGIIRECPYYFNDWTAAETYGDIVTSVSGLSINEGATNTFTVHLSAAPTNDQVVALSSNNADITVSPSSLTFTSENYSTAQTVTVSAAEDDDTTNDAATITLSSNKVVNKTVSITVADNDESAVTPTTYTITNNLTNCTNSNNAASVEENASYTATLTANDGYTLGTPVITMGDTDVTSAVYSGGNINITSVTGNVVITCNATANSSSGGEAVLLHSYDASTANDGDAVWTDQTNNFDLPVIEGKTIVKNGDGINITDIHLAIDIFSSTTNFLLGNKPTDFTIVFKLKANDIYAMGLMHTGSSSRIDVRKEEYYNKSVDGRFSIGNISNGTTWFDGAGMKYYTNNALSNDNRFEGRVDLSEKYIGVYIFRYDLSTHTMSLDRYANHDGTNEGVYTHNTSTPVVESTESGLLFHAIHLNGRHTIYNMNLYSGVMSDEQAEVIAKGMLGIQ